MPRIHIEEPGRYTFEVEHRIRVNELNYGNHLGNDAVLAMMQEARIRMLEKHKMSEFDIGGVSLIQGDVAVVYKSEGKWGDLLRIEMAVTDIGKSSFDIVYRISHKNDGRLLAIAKTGMVCFDYESAKVKPVPDQFRSLFSQP